MEAKKPFLALDARIMDNKEYQETIRLDVEYNRILFEFPEGFSSIPLIEECRALNDLDNFDLMYDVTMQMLIGKPVVIILRDYDNGKHVLDKFLVTERYMDLRGVRSINSYPILVNWMVKFVAEHLRKKYPKPLEEELRATTSEDQSKAKQKKNRTTK
jgi:hypothetical protein